MRYSTRRWASARPHMGMSGSMMANAHTRSRYTASYSLSSGWAALAQWAPAWAPQVARAELATIGRAVPKAPRSSAILIARGYAMTPNQNHGIRRIPPVGLTEVAARASRHATGWQASENP